MNEKRVTLMVGAFVALGSILIFIVIILLGQERSLFESTTNLYVAFENVSGLKPGSQVRLAGVAIGTVTGIDFAQNLGDKNLHVELQIREAMMPRIRKDSIATVSSKGLLGDKVIDISIGSDTAEPLKEGDYLDSEEPPDLFTIMEKGQALISHGADVAKDIKTAIRKIIDEETVTHIKSIISSIDEVIKEVETGDGIAHGLIYDAKVQADLKTTMHNVRSASGGIRKSVDHVENILGEVRTGKGTLHGIIYDEDGKKILENIREASATISEVVSAIKDRKGMLHTLIYEEDKGNIIKNLEDASTDIRKLARYIEQGNGTIGGLIKDPTVYEDLKSILGNLKRNAALKALIRMSLEKQDDVERLRGEESRIQSDTMSTQP